MRQMDVSFYILSVSWLLSVSDTVSSPSGFRLPGDLRPINYELEVVPYLELKTFDGDVVIHFEVINSTGKIVLNYWDIKIRKEDIDVFEERSLQRLNVKDVLFDTTHEIVTIVLDTLLNVGKKFYINIVYKGILYNEITGFYVSEVTDKNGVKSYLAATHLKPTYARTLMPCFDEPGFKAYFSIRVSRPDGYFSLSNMPRMQTLRDKRRENRWLDFFQKTFYTPTYLIAIVVTDFPRSTNEAGNFSTYAQKDFLPETTFAHDLGPRLVRAMADWLGIPYPLPKLDQVAITQFDPNVEILESWGLVLYQSRYLVSNGSQWKQMLEIARMSAQAAAMQWFGNVVTPIWWSYAWLSEGLAGFFECFLIHLVNPSLLLTCDSLASENIYKAIDSEVTDRRPVVMDGVNSPTEIQNMFTDVLDAKGSIIVRMIMYAVGQKAFQKGVRNYVLSRMLSNSDSQQFLMHIEKAGKDVGVLQKDIDLPTAIEPWLRQTGLPYINVTRDYMYQKVNVDQETALEKPGKKWWIPLSWTSAGQKDYTVAHTFMWLRPQDPLDIEIKGIYQDEWILFNVQTSGYYLVNYDEKNWNLLKKFVHSDTRERMHYLNRIALLHDSFKLAEDGVLSYRVPLSMSTYLASERIYSVWVAGYNRLLDVKTFLRGSNIYEDFSTFVNSLKYSFSRNLKSCRDTTAIEAMKMMRGALTYCRRGDEGCNLWAKLSRDRDCPGWEELQDCVDLASIIASNGPAPSSDHLPRKRLVSALPCYPDQDYVLSLSGELLRDPAITSEEVHTLLLALADAYPESTDKFILRHLKRIMNRVNEKTIRDVTAQLHHSSIKKASRFRPTKALRKQARITAREWQKKYLKTVQDWLLQHNCRGSATYSTTENTISECTSTSLTASTTTTELSSSYVSDSEASSKTEPTSTVQLSSSPSTYENHFTTTSLTTLMTSEISPPVSGASPGFSATSSALSPDVCFSKFLLPYLLAAITLVYTSYY